MNILTLFLPIKIPTVLLCSKNNLDDCLANVRVKNDPSSDLMTELIYSQTHGIISKTH